ncbi:hypothetical protein MBLNU13_g05327t2 [Cladosporium sp. NU13]
MALAAISAFFGGMLSVYRAKVNVIIKSDQIVADTAYTLAVTQPGLARSRSDPRGCVTRVDRRYLIVIHEENNEDKGVEERNCAYARARDIQRKRGDQAKSRARSKSLGGSETPTKRRPSTRISSASFDYRQEVVWW